MTIQNITDGNDKLFLLDPCVPTGASSCVLNSVVFKSKIGGTASRHPPFTLTVQMHPSLDFESPTLRLRWVERRKVSRRDKGGKLVLFGDSPRAIIAAHDEL